MSVSILQMFRLNKYPQLEGKDFNGFNTSDVSVEYEIKNDDYVTISFWVSILQMFRLNYS